MVYLSTTERSRKQASGKASLASNKGLLDPDGEGPQLLGIIPAGFASLIKEALPPDQWGQPAILPLEDNPSLWSALFNPTNPLLMGPSSLAILYPAIGSLLHRP